MSIENHLMAMCVIVEQTDKRTTWYMPENCFGELRGDGSTLDYGRYDIKYIAQFGEKFYFRADDCSLVYMCTEDDDELGVVEKFATFMNDDHPEIDQETGELI